MADLDGVELELQNVTSAINILVEQSEETNKLLKEIAMRLNDVVQAINDLD